MIARCRSLSQCDFFAFAGESGIAEEGRRRGDLEGGRVDGEEGVWGDLKGRGGEERLGLLLLYSSDIIILYYNLFICLVTIVERYYYIRAVLLLYYFL